DRGRRLAHAAGRPLLQALERATLRRATVLWAISPASRTALAAAAGIPEERVRVVPIPVDARRFAPLDDAAWEERLARPELVVAEALVAGVPALVTPCGGPEDLVRDSGGGEVLSGFDPHELADRAEALLGDRARLLEMRRRGHAHVVREHDPARLRDALRDA